MSRRKKVRTDRFLSSSWIVSASWAPSSGQPSFSQRRIQMRQTKPTPSRRAFVATSLGAGVLLAAQMVPSYSQNRSSKMEATIRIGSDITTLVNVFTVEPENQQKLVQLLKEGTESFFSKQPGFISSSVHTSKEGRRAINYSQWRSAKD